ncbi:MAG: carbohydrate ABC transporter permease [Candidatus Humimicrobiaceae bacterium]
MFNVKKYKASYIFSRIGIHSVLIMWAVFQIFPIFWMVMSSLKPDGKIFGEYILSLPDSFYFDNYKNVLIPGDSGFQGGYKGIEATVIIYLRNSVIVTILSLLLLIVTAYIAAYGIAKLKFKGKNILLTLFICIMGIPVHTLIIPLYYFISKLGLLNNFFGLVLIYVGFGIPFTVLMLQSYFKDFPDEIIEAAKIDGCGSLGAFFRIVIPVSKNAISMVFVMNFIGIWNEFLVSLIILKNIDVKTMPVGMLQFNNFFRAQWGNLFAVLTIAIIPTIVIYFIFQRYIIEGARAGAIKG